MWWRLRLGARRQRVIGGAQVGELGVAERVVVEVLLEPGQEGVETDPGDEDEATCEHTGSRAEAVREVQHCDGFTRSAWMAANEAVDPSTPDTPSSRTSKTRRTLHQRRWRASAAVCSITGEATASESRVAIMIPDSGQSACRTQYEDRRGLAGDRVLA